MPGVGGARLGQRTAGDATALSARRGDEARQKAETRLGLPQPTGGRKEYLDAEGKVERVVEWFGYKLHLLVDVHHELALAYGITAPAVGDNQMIESLETIREPSERLLLEGDYIEIVHPSA